MKSARLSVAVMAHPKRAKWVPALVDKLDTDPMVVYDRKNNRWDTGRRAMLAYDPEATHHLVVQDDAILPRDLAAGLERAIEHCPYDRAQPLMMCLYVGRTRPYAAYVQQLVDEAPPDCSWLTMSEIHWGVGILVDTTVIRQMIAWCDRETVPNYDKRIGRWGLAHGITAWYPWPSLVDHRDSPSLVPGRRAANRWAHKFIGDDASALDVEWTATVADIGDLGQARPQARRQKARTVSTAPKPTWRPVRREEVPQMAAVEENGGTIMVARKTARLIINGKPRRIQRGITTANNLHPIVTGREHLWEPLRVDYPAPATTAADSGPSTEGEKSEPHPGDLENNTVEELEGLIGDMDRVREWAEAQGIELKSGYVPKSVLIQYLRSAAATG